MADSKDSTESNETDSGSELEPEHPQSTSSPVESGEAESAKNQSSLDNDDEVESSIPPDEFELLNSEASEANSDEDSVAEDANNKTSRKTEKAKKSKGSKKKKAKDSKQSSDKNASISTSNLLGKIGDVTSSAFKFARKTTDTSYKVGKALFQSQDQLKLMVAAGQSLKDLREVAGLTISELNDALQLKDKSLLEAVENGTATLSFELILRLSALLARNDPIPFILKYSRAYSPETWKILSDWGAGRLPIQYQREREFINIFRSKDEARQLSDEGYNKVLEFTREAFNMSLHFVSEQEAAVKAFEDSLKATSDKDSDTEPDEQ